MSNVTLKGGSPVKAPKPPKPKRMGWRYFLVWLAGFFSFFLIVGITGAILGSSFTTKELILMFSGNPNDILQPGYQDMSVLEFITTLSTSKFETLGDIDRVTPIVKNTFDEQIAPVLEGELHYCYPWDELKTKPFQLPVKEREGVDTTEDLGTYLGRAIKEGVTLSSFITGDEVPNFVNIFLYPRLDNGDYDYDHPYTLMDFITADNDFFNNIINGVKVKDVMDIDPDDKFMNAIKDWSISGFTQDNLNTLSLSLFLDETSTNPLIQTLCGWTVGDLQNENKFKSLLLGDVIAVTDTTPKLIKTLMSVAVVCLKQLKVKH